MKTTRTIILLATAAAALVSCSKESPISEEKNRNEPVEGGVMVFSAALQAPDETRTSIGADNATVSWAADDEVDIFWAADGAVTAGVDVSDGTITAEVGSASSYYAVYPAGKASFDGTALQVGIEAASDGTFAKANYEAAVTTASAKSFAFKNVSGLVKFTVANASVRKVRIRANDGTALTGTVGVTFDDEGNPVFGDVTTPGDEIVVSVGGAGTYYAAVLPTANLENGFGIRYEDAAGNSLGSILSTGALSWSAGKVKNIGTPETAFHPDGWFIKEDGTGNGSSWDQAGGATLLRKLLGRSQSSDGYTNAWRLDGQTIHVAEGTYNLYDGEPATLNHKETATFSVLGGYPAGATGTDLTGRDPEAHKTYLTTTATRVLYAYNAPLDLMVDGFYFSGLPDGLARGAVFYANASSSGKVAFKDCVFENNKFDGRGLINTGLDLTVTGCNFSGNHATSTTANYGGTCLYITGGALKADGCRFTDNASEENGAAITFNGNSTSLLYVNGCSFTGNRSPKAVISLAPAATTPYCAKGCFFGSTFYNNNTPKSDIEFRSVPVIVAACSFAEGNRDNGILHNTAKYGDSNSWALSSIIVGPEATSYSIGTGGSIQTTYLIFSALNNTARVGTTGNKKDKSYPEIYGETPSLNADGHLVPLSTYTDYGSIGAETAKSTISSFDADFAAWLEALGAYPDGEKWKPGSYQF